MYYYFNEFRIFNFHKQNTIKLYNFHLISRKSYKKDELIHGYLSVYSNAFSL